MVGCPRAIHGSHSICFPAKNSNDESGATRGIRTQGIVAMEFGSSSSEESNDELGTLEKEHPLSGEKEVKDDDKPTEESNAVTKASLKGQFFRD